MDAHHFGITVSDLEESLVFYRDELGLDVIQEFEVEGEAFATAMDVPGAEADFAHLAADGARVELVSYEPAGADRRGGSVNDLGGTHLGLSVEDLDATYENLSPTVETLSEPQTTSTGTYICFLRDPDGNLVELLEA